MLKGIEQYEGMLIGLGVASVAMIVGSVILIPLIIAFLPEDYFVRTIKPFRELSPPHMLGRCLKNLIGLVILLSGFVMLFLPGQGILTILLGFSLVDFPGKRRMELRLLAVPRVQRMIQWARSKTGRPPMRLPVRGSQDSHS